MDQLYTEAIQRFSELLERAKKTDIREPTAMTLATCDGEGRPSARTVLLKGCDMRGFVFYTNTESRKGRQLDANPRAALCFHWQPLEHQVLIEGPVEPVADEEADAYWKTRPRDSQIGAWASNQSSVLECRDQLVEAVGRLKEKFDGQDIPRPPHWRGYRVRPQRIEFWRSQPSRLHRRVVFEKENGSWSEKLLYP